MVQKDIFATPNGVTHGRGYVYSLQYHIVWCTKYRKRVFVGDARVSELKAWLLKAASDLEMSITAMEIMPDHIHLLVDARPQLRLSDAIKVLKGASARWMFLKHPEIKRSLWGGHLWNPSYFVATVSDRSREQVERYIANQETKG